MCVVLFSLLCLCRELAELHKANASKDSAAQELALSHQVQAKEELEQALEHATEEARMQQEALANQVAVFLRLPFCPVGKEDASVISGQRPVLIVVFLCSSMQVADLRLALQRAEQQQARKEDYLREEISELQQVCILCNANNNTICIAPFMQENRQDKNLERRKGQRKSLYSRERPTMVEQCSNRRIEE